MSAAAGAASAQTVDQLAELSIEELANVEITSVSRRPEMLGQAAASVFVISSEDVRRAGVLTLPEALRLAPNLQVTRIDSLDYAISARGLNSFESANKLLVLIDGRSVYTPLYSGVDWDAQHVLLADLDRIEVISGPGGTLWGSNAVNGVVSVTTRDSRETQGLLARVAGGALSSDASLRYGGRLGGGGYRLYADVYERGPTELASGRSAKDAWRGVQLGFRSDFGGEQNGFTLQGDHYDNDLKGGDHTGGTNLLGRWEGSALGGRLHIQGYYDRVARRARFVQHGLRTFDVSMQHSITVGRHQLVWGGGFRHVKDHFANLLQAAVTLDPSSRGISLGNAFVQDEIRLAPTLRLTAGLKVEGSSYTGVDYMPSLRLAWTPNPSVLVWAAASRAVRIPSRIERELTLSGVLIGDIFDRESLVAYELGYRAQFGDRASVSVTGYVHDYDDIRSNERRPGTALPIFVGNGLKGRTWGVEAWGAYAVTPWWRLSAGFSTLGKDFEIKPGVIDISGLEASGVDPDYSLQARSQMQLGRRVELDLRLRAVDDTPRGQASGYVGAPGYAEADARLAWRVNDAVELAVSGFNLLHDRHREASETRATEIPRSVQASLRWRY